MNTVLYQFSRDSPEDKALLLWLLYYGVDATWKWYAIRESRGEIVPRLPPQKSLIEQWLPFLYKEKYRPLPVRSYGTENAIYHMKRIADNVYAKPELQKASLIMAQLYERMEHGIFEHRPMVREFLTFLGPCSLTEEAGAWDRFQRHLDETRRSPRIPNPASPMVIFVRYTVRAYYRDRSRRQLEEPQPDTNEEFDPLYPDRKEH